MRVVTIGWVLAACGAPLQPADPPAGADGDTGTEGGADTAEPWTGIRITAPREGEGFYRRVPMTWQVRDFQLDAGAIGAAAEEGVGHVHVYLDTVFVGEAVEDGWTVEGLSGGAHTLEVRLAGNDHAELPLTDRVGVRALDPRVMVIDPVDDVEIRASATPVALQVYDFVLVADYGAAPEFGRGHFVVRVDGEPRFRGTDPAAARVTRLTEGEHVLDAELVDHDGSPLEPPVTSPPVEVRVPPGTPWISLGEERAEPWDSATLPVAPEVLHFAGHYHLYLDGLWAGEGLAPETVLRHVGPGSHTLRAVLAEASHSEIASMDVIDLELSADRPDVTITYPGERWDVHEGFEMALSVENFTLDAAYPSTPVEDRGHYEVSLDGVRIADGSGATMNVTGTTPGTHALRVQLVGNDGAPLDPPVWDEITISVGG